MAERIVVVGAGFAGLETVKRLEKVLRHEMADGSVEVVLVAPNDYMLYLPLLPQVAAGVITAQSVTVPLPRAVKRAHRLPGTVVGVDLERKNCVVRKISGDEVDLPFDRIVLAPGSVTRQFDIPGLEDHALGMKNLAQAAYLRDHVLAQLELANAATDDEERAARCRFVVVGGGYAGTETAACLQLLTESALKRFPRLDPGMVRWTLVDIAPRLMPELGKRLGEQALDLLRRRGVEIKLETGVKDVTDEAVTFSDGEVVACRTLVWTAGVTSSPLVKNLGVELNRGRVRVGADLQIEGHPGVFALGDCAAVPDLTQDDADAICPPTAQHASRMATTAADNVVASLRGEPLTQYKHHDLGLVVDLGGTQAVAHPLNLELKGAPAQAVTRGYHLFALPLMRTRARVVANWILHLFGGDDFIRIGFLSDRKATVDEFEGTQSYLSHDEIRARAS
ncbi:NAD(P)/FAD-dependent oxidoreductase [Actinomycetospora termitidis]|uniref:NAD(P)/FAD-dependent oxidoreductase n=1 Tax=Actinomycetospora termitidis TaxID=3053470 RepID=A0ABT7M537_9PSEU|nr:NAD(P)/FAD-dependent oxidoreductase [Actinomycetospora sp. Odt1-22]MDL5155800.1 NAD(P)/FAD-dependent oxidoreductase [Actinomycetospora sp. Odt1-22]